MVPNNTHAIKVFHLCSLSYHQNRTGLQWGYFICASIHSTNTLYYIKCRSLHWVQTVEQSSDFWSRTNSIQSHHSEKVIRQRCAWGTMDILYMTKFWSWVYIGNFQQVLSQRHRKHGGKCWGEEVEASVTWKRVWDSKVSIYWVNILLQKLYSIAFKSILLS